MKKILLMILLTAVTGVAQSKDGLITNNSFSKTEVNISKGDIENLIKCSKTDPDCSLSLAVAYLYGKGVESNFNKAEHYFLNSSELGNAKSYYFLGVMYKDGLINSEVDLKAALEYFEKGSKLSDTQAQMMAANAYAIGEGTVVNLPKALELYLQAVDQNFPLAQLKACHFYIYGWGTEQNFEKSFSLCSKAALNGEPTAFASLADHFYEGAHVPKNITKAYALMLVSKELGNSNIEKYLPRISSQLTVIQMKEAHIEKKSILENFSNNTLKFSD